MSGPRREATAGGIMPPSRSPLLFCLLMAVTGVPFWALDIVAGPLPWLPMNLPASALQFVSPIVVAALLVHRAEGAIGVRRLLARLADHRRITRRAWYVPLVLLMPASLTLAYLVMRATGRPLPEPHIPPAAIPLLALAFLVGAVCEEAGWTGYATDPLLRRYGTLGTGVLLGVVWAAVHVLPWHTGHDWMWVAWQGVATVAIRVMIVTLYVHDGGSVFGAVLFHDMVNVSDGLFPNGGSHYDPAVAGPILVACAALLVVAGRLRPRPGGGNGGIRGSGDRPAGGRVAPG
ncbi:CPBP family glutamic-type intramembrane protease [Sphaerisporangium rufum]|nr:CPBP family intramembrane glutamic endopeptidase [Sphaerisporangium rufum]